MKRILIGLMLVFLLVTLTGCADLQERAAEEVGRLTSAMREELETVARQNSDRITALETQIEALRVEIATLTEDLRTMQPQPEGGG